MPNKPSDKLLELELAARCEAASGADRELDAQATVAARILPDKVEPWVVRYPVWRASEIPGRVEVINDEGEMAVWFTAPKFTASLDEAMTLVPEGYRMENLGEHWRSGRWHAHLAQRVSAALLERFDEGHTIGWNTADTEQAGAASPALALCAAALRARATTEGQAHD